VNRRQFLSTTATTAATAAATIAATVATTGALASAQDKPIRLAVIGVGGRGTALMKQFAKVPGAEIGAVVDPDGNRTEQAASWIVQNIGNRPKAESDMRRVFEDRSIDAVIIATTNHWHTLTAIWAMQAGKHVYCEKPVSHDIFESRQLVAAARKYNRIVQGGTQRRSAGLFRRAIQLIHEGAIGDLYLAKWTFPGNRDSIGIKPTEPPPNWLNWDLWLGPAPEQPYHANLVHYNWHWFWDFGNGDLGNNGIHLVDISRWGMRKELPTRVNCWGGRFGYKDQAETPNTQTVRWEYPDGTAIVGEIRGLYTAEPMSWDFFGTKGHLHMDDDHYQLTLGRNKQPEPPVDALPEVNHYANWVEAVRANDRTLLNAEIRETALSTNMCHIGNIAYRVGHELTFDPAGEHFRDCAEANALLKRSGRPPYTIPDEV
jgi:predicted dehydrogenase